MYFVTCDWMINQRQQSSFECNNGMWQFSVLKTCIFLSNLDPAADLLAELLSQMDRAWIFKEDTGISIQGDCSGSYPRCLPHTDLYAFIYYVMIVNGKSQLSTCLFYWWEEDHKDIEKQFKNWVERGREGREGRMFCFVCFWELSDGHKRHLSV